MLPAGLSQGGGSRRGKLLKGRNSQAKGSQLDKSLDRRVEALEAPGKFPGLLDREPTYLQNRGFFGVPENRVPYK